MYAVPLLLKPVELWNDSPDWVGKIPYISEFSNAVKFFP